MDSDVEPVMGASLASVRILAAGIDSLYISVKGAVRGDLIDVLSEKRREAVSDGRPALFVVGDDAHRFEVRARGRRQHALCLVSPSFDLCLEAPAPHPDAYVELRSAFIHQLGVEQAVGYVSALLAEHVVSGPMAMTVSRVDVYADQQGWVPSFEEIGRFVTRAKTRNAFEQVHARGRQLTGITFGRGEMVARIYDKSLEMQLKGSTWQHLIWRDYDGTQPVWRLEFQYRRSALNTFRLPGGRRSLVTPAEVLEHRQALWDYGTRWLTLRRLQGSDSNVTRWEEADEWSALRAARVGSPHSDLVRARVRGDDEVSLVRGFVGYATSLTARGSAYGLDKVVLVQVPAASRYLQARGASFDSVVEAKRQRRMRLPGSENALVRRARLATTRAASGSS